MKLRRNFNTNQEVSVPYCTKALSDKYVLAWGWVFFDSQHGLYFSYM